MIIVHHLNNSRSQRILWLLEELEVPYEIKFYQRDATTNLAPPELKDVHPLGKSPVVEDGELKIAESGAAVGYLIRTYGDGRLQPPPGPERDRYFEWLHYAEGSAMLPLMLKFYTMRLGEAAAPLKPRIDEEIENHLGFVEAELEGRPYLMGEELTGADIQMSFVGEIATVLGSAADKSNLSAWVKRLHARPAYAKAVEKGGAYAFA
jgi:glutathione S-transferase